MVSGMATPAGQLALSTREDRGLMTLQVNIALSPIPKQGTPTGPHGPFSIGFAWDQRV